MNTFLLRLDQRMQFLNRWSAAHCKFNFAIILTRIYRQKYGIKCVLKEEFA